MHHPLARTAFMTTDTSRIQYRVVKNHEDQYSIWPTEKKLPNGWNALDQVGTTDECLIFIDKHSQETQTSL